MIYNIIDDLKSRINKMENIDFVISTISENCQFYKDNDLIQDYSIKEKNSYDTTNIDVYLTPKKVVDTIVVSVTFPETEEMMRKRRIKEKRKMRQEKLNKINEKNTSINIY